MKRKQTVKITKQAQAPKKQVKTDRGQTLFSLARFSLIFSVLALLAVAVIQYYLIIQVPSEKRTNRYFWSFYCSFGNFWVLFLKISI